MIIIYDKDEHSEEFIEISEPKLGCWIHIENATTNDINQISKLINLEYTDMYDALDRYEVPRVEKVAETVLIFTRHPIDQEAGLYTTTFTMILTKDYFITICPQKSQIVENFLSQKPKFKMVTLL